MNEQDVFVLAGHTLDRVVERIADDATLMQRPLGLTGRNPE